MKDIDIRKQEDSDIIANWWRWVMQEDNTIDDDDLKLDRVMDVLIERFGFIDCLMYLQTRCWVRSESSEDAWEQASNLIEEAMSIIPEKSKFIEGE
jgi:hypothetical protein